MKGFSVAKRDATRKKNTHTHIKKHYLHLQMADRTKCKQITVLLFFFKAEQDNMEHKSACWQNRNSCLSWIPCLAFQRCTLKAVFFLFWATVAVVLELRNTAESYLDWQWNSLRLMYGRLKAPQLWKPAPHVREQRIRTIIGPRDQKTVLKESRVT